MIDYLYGTINSKSAEGVTIDVNGIGYGVTVPALILARFPEIGSPVKVYIAEAAAGMYGGVISLYGFLTTEEREMYLLIKDKVPGTGARKAIEYIDKISISFEDFKTAIISKNSPLLSGMFGFTKKTADKLIAALKDKISALNVPREEKWAGAKESENTMVLETIESLIALGYKEQQARAAVNNAYRRSNDGSSITIESLIRKSLQYL